MKRVEKTQVLATGLAMFSMFFGAGNVVFPLALGKSVGDMNPFAIIGLLISAVGVPFLGLISMILFDGDYKKYIYRVGQLPGFLLLLLIIALIGPFGAMPRLITVSYASVKPFLPDVSLFAFSLFAAALIYVLSIKETKILDLLGYILGPVLLISLALIVLKGYLVAPAAPVLHLSALHVFYEGFTTGYQTMDLLAAMFFSAVVLAILKRNFEVRSREDYKKLALVSVKASCISAVLLSIVYIGMSSIASFYATSLTHVKDQELLGVIAQQVLGNAGSFVVAIAVGLACLTTVIALAAVCAEFVQKELFLGQLGYGLCLVLTLMLTVACSTLEFEGIAHMISPLLSLCYPALIVLAICNIGYKLFFFRFVKTLVMITMILTIIFSYFPEITSPITQIIWH